MKKVNVLFFFLVLLLFNSNFNHLLAKNKISDEHITNNKAVRDTLLSRDIIPENVKPQEDIQKVERKLNSETKKILKSKDKLKTTENE